MGVRKQEYGFTQLISQIRTLSRRPLWSITRPEHHQGAHHEESSLPLGRRVRSSGSGRRYLFQVNDQTRMALRPYHPAQWGQSR
jgi:hypothetical protein